MGTEILSLEEIYDSCDPSVVLAGAPRSVLEDWHSVQTAKFLEESWADRPTLPMFRGNLDGSDVFLRPEDRAELAKRFEIAERIARDPNLRCFIDNIEGLENDPSKEAYHSERREAVKRFDDLVHEYRLRAAEQDELQRKAAEIERQKNERDASIWHQLMDSTLVQPNFQGGFVDPGLPTSINNPVKETVVEQEVQSQSEVKISISESPASGNPASIPKTSCEIKERPVELSDYIKFKYVAGCPEGKSERATWRLSYQTRSNEELLVAYMWRLAEAVKLGLYGGKLNLKLQVHNQVAGTDQETLRVVADKLVNSGYLKIAKGNYV